MQTGEGFILRSADFKLRVKVIVWTNKDPGSRKKRPYKLTMKNLNMDEPIQVKLSSKGGYEWIESGAYITKLTDEKHDHEFLDSSGNTLLAVRLYRARTEL